MRRAFTPRDVEELRYLGAYGMSAREIARQTGRTTSQIFRAARTHGIALGLDRRPWTCAQVSRVRALAALALPGEMVAALVGRTPTAIEAVHHQHGIRVAPRPWPIRTHVTAECWRVLTAAGHHDVQRTAGVTLELATRRPDMLPAVLAPAAVAPRSAPLSSLQPQLAARVA
jgi:hypothetical protein